MNFVSTIIALSEEAEGGHEITIAPKVLFHIGPVPVTETMISGTLAVVLALIFFAVVRIFFIPRWEKQPFKKSRFRILMEKWVQLFDKTAKDQTHKYASVTGPIYFGLSTYIAFATLMELFALRPATTDFNATIALGVVTFLMVFILGFVKKKSKRFKHYLLPPVIEAIPDFVVPISMGIRLFASMFSGYIIMDLIYQIPFAIIYPVIGNILLTLFHAVVQAYVFMLLSMSFINEAIE